MDYTKKIEIYRIINAEFVTPLAIAPEEKRAKYNEGDFVIIINNTDFVWVTNRDGVTEDEYALAVFSPAFVRMNPGIFEKID